MNETTTQSTSTSSNNNSSTTNSFLLTDKAADNTTSLETKLECETYLNSQLEHYKKQDWSDFSTAGRSHVSLQMAQTIIFKQAIDNFKKDNPKSSHEPKFKTKPDWFGYGVEVEMILIEECPTNLGQPFILTHHHECYFDGDGRIKYTKKFIE